MNKIERDPYISIVAMSDEAAMRCVGPSAVRAVCVGPPPRPDRYHPQARLWHVYIDAPARRREASMKVMLYPGYTPSWEYTGASAYPTYLATALAHIYALAGAGWREG